MRFDLFAFFFFFICGVREEFQCVYYNELPSTVRYMTKRIFLINFYMGYRLSSEVNSGTNRGIVFLGAYQQSEDYRPFGFPLGRY